MSPIEEERPVLDELLAITKEIEQNLGASEPQGLSALLARRGEVFARLDVEAIPPEAEALLREIRASEDRCLEMAAAQKQELQADMSAVRTQRRVEKAYGSFNVG